jgi:LmbE family N-acetylglucosaminyl deacetylase
MNKSRTKEKILVVCAHPDDETLGLGGTLANHSKNGDDIYVVFFAHGQYGRDASKAGIRKRQNQAKRACGILGIKNLKFYNYDDQLLEKIPLIELTSKIELIIKKFKPTILYTHYSGDLNQDHRRIFEAVLISSRPKPSSKIKKLVCFETPSSTEWGNLQDGFKPNLFVDIKNVLKKKIEALKQYGSEIEDFPHPRSVEAIVSRAKYWGSTVGLTNVEVFLIVRQVDFNNN